MVICGKLDNNYFAFIIVIITTHIDLLLKMM
jgi:hypothetical protein